MLPQDSVVLLVAAHHIRKLERLTRGGVMPAVEILDRTQTIAAKTKVIGVDTCTIIPKIKGAFTRVRHSGIAIRDKHLRQREAVEETPAIVPGVMQGEAFAIVEAHPHTPLLPVKEITFHFEGRPFWLDDLIRFRSRARRGPQIWMILAERWRVGLPMVIKPCIFTDTLVLRRGQMIDLGDLELLRNLGTQIERVRIVIGIRVIKKPQIEPALDRLRRQPIVLQSMRRWKPHHRGTFGHIVHPISRVGPWLNHDLGTLWKLELPNLSFNPRICPACFLGSLHIRGIDIWVFSHEILFLDHRPRGQINSELYHLVRP